MPVDVVAITCKDEGDLGKKIAKLNKPLVNRIIGHGEEQVDQLLANPLNFRLHPDNQQQALAGAIDDIGFIREVSGLPVVVKGIMRGVDADTAIRAGAAAIQVSNHGGRQLDGVPASISVLQEVATAVGGRVPVYFDSGIRRGVDVIKAVALGADAVAIGRPVLFALTLGGALGVQSAIEHLRDEVKTAMLSLGAKNLADLRKDYIKQAIA